MICVSGKLSISVFAFIAAIFFALSQGLFCSFVFFGAIFIHELSHIFFILRFGGRIEKITVYPFGIDILADTHLLSYKKEIVIALSGSCANLLCALFGCIVFRTFPNPNLLFFILCHLSLGLFNLIPLSFFDGGRALRLFLFDVFELDTAFCLQRVFDIVFSLFFLSVCLTAVLYSNINLSVFMLAVYACLTVLYFCSTKRSRHISAP